MEKYVNKGLAEIHWGSKKTSHFELINKLLQQEGFRDLVLISLERIVKNFDSSKTTNIVSNIDNDLINIGNPNILPKERKELIVKLLTLRFNKLEKIYSQNK